MNILRVIASMDPKSGGPCQGIRNSIPEMTKLGAANEVVCLDAPNASYLNNELITIHAIGPSSGPWQSSPNLIPFLLANLSRFDAVIVHGLWLYHGYAVRKAINTFAINNKGNKAPKVYVMPHGMLDPYFQKAGGRKIKALRNWVYWQLIESKLVNRANGLLFTCEAELLLARKPFKPYHPKKEINVGYGISKPPCIDAQVINDFRIGCKGLNNAPYFLFLSRIHEKKGVDLLLQAYALYLESHMQAGSQRGLHSAPKLVVAGPGMESDYGQLIRKIIDERPVLDDKVLFPGMLTGNAKWGAFHGCEAFILPSHQENFGIAVVEALACGKPVLISDQVNIWKEIHAAKAGFVAPDTLHGTLDLITRYQQRGAEERKTLEANALNCYKQNFTIDAASSKLFNALNN